MIKTFTANDAIGVPWVSVMLILIEQVCTMKHLYFPDCDLF